MANREGRISARAADRWFFGHSLPHADRRWLLDHLTVERSDLLSTRSFPNYSLDGVPCRYVLTSKDRLLRARL